MLGSQSKTVLPPPRVSLHTLHRHLPTSPQPHSPAPLRGKILICKLIPWGLGDRGAVPARQVQKLGDPQQLLGLTGLENELKLPRNSPLELFSLGRQAGREGGGKKSLPRCQQAFNVSEQPLPTPALAQAAANIKAMLFHRIQPSDPKPLPAPQTDMQNLNLPSGLGVQREWAKHSPV